MRYKKEISVEEKLKDTEDKLLRSVAELKIKEEGSKKVKMPLNLVLLILQESLAILDNLQRAKIAIKNDKGLKDNKDLDKFLENIDIIEKDLLSIFERNNIKKISTKDKKFDPNLHQAMTEIEDDKKEPGTVVQEIQSGYMLGERLLRPALVAVAKKNNSKNEQKDEKK